MLNLINDFLNITYVSKINPEDVQLGILPASFCRSNLVVPVKDDTGSLCFVMSNPFVPGILENLKKNLQPDQEFRILMTKPDNVWELSLNPSSVPG